MFWRCLGSCSCCASSRLVLSDIQLYDSMRDPYARSFTINLVLSDCALCDQSTAMVQAVPSWKQISLFFALGVDQVGYAIFAICDVARFVGIFISSRSLELTIELCY